MSAPLPLSRFERLHTLDVDEARDVIAEAFCPHRLEPLDGGHRFATRFHSARTGNVSLSYLDYGGTVHITPHEQESFYLVLISRWPAAPTSLTAVSRRSTTGLRRPCHRWIAGTTFT